MKRKIKMIRVGRERLKEAVEIVGAVNEQMQEKSWFVAESFEEFDRWMKEEKGILYLAEDEETGEVGGMFFVILPGMDEENLGHDISMQGENLIQCAMMDTAAVLPEFRGNHLQYDLMQMAERDLEKMGYRYLLCTVHPENRFSRENVRSQGYEKVLTKEKYGGYLRDIWMKKLENIR